VLGYAVYTDPRWAGRMTLKEARSRALMPVPLPCQWLILPVQLSGVTIWAFTGWWWTTTQDSGSNTGGLRNRRISARVLSLMEAGATWQLLEQSVHIHPTYGEALPACTAAERTCRRAQICKENSLMTTNLQVGDRFPILNYRITTMNQCGSPSSPSLA